MRWVLTILLVFIEVVASGKVIPVSKNGVISSLKQAIAMADNGDTILLHKGVYQEGNIRILKSIRLIGVDNPILDGEGKWEILTIEGSRVIVKGIHFRNSGYSSLHDYAAIGAINTSYVIVENNTFEGAYFAIHFANARNCMVRNNRISSHFKSEQISGNGIHFWKCDSMVVANNQISGHRDGIYFEFVTNSYIYGNRSEKNIRYGLHFMFSNNDAYFENTFRNNGAGVAVMYSRQVEMFRNVFEINWGPSAYGILLKEISDGRMYGNTFMSNTVGILMESTNRIEVRHNQFSNNGYALRMQASCDQNEIHHNNFQGNTFDVATNGSLMLSSFFNNYWDKYEGYDLNRDGVGDVPYHPVSLYSMIIEQNPVSVLLLRSFMVTLLDKTEKAVPSLTPEKFADAIPLMKSLSL